MLPLSDALVDVEVLSRAERSFVDAGGVGTVCPSADVADAGAEFVPAAEAATR